ncbi:MAG: potassium channel protein [Nitrosomonadales bacterium]|nr:potassium channel protein [Nitrosomonadales bacterium]
MMEQENSHTKTVRHLAYAFLALVAIMLTGTVGYRILGGEQYSWLDCFYMTFITLTTIGYIEAVDVRQYEYGRLFTVFIGFTGIGVLGYVLSTVTAFMLESDLNSSWRRRKMKQKIAQLKDHYIVCGVGLVGGNVARELAATGRVCVIVDANMSAIHRFLESHPGQLWLHGDATGDDVLLAAGVMNARGVFAVAHDDSMNLVISLSAKQINPKLRVVARCHYTRNFEKTRRAGADEVVSPDFTGGLRIVSAMVRPNVASFLDDMFKSDDSVRIEEISVPEELSGKALSVLYHGNKDSLVLALRHDGGWQFNPSSLQIVQGGDVLMVMATAEGRIRLEQLMQGAG